MTKSKRCKQMIAKSQTTTRSKVAIDTKSTAYTDFPKLANTPREPRGIESKQELTSLYTHRGWETLPLSSAVRRRLDEIFVDSTTPKFETETVP